MGLFSFLNKNKQDSRAQDSGRFSGGDDDAIAQRARAKRASHAGEGARRGRGVDPVLPEKKRARRRLVGAIALALAAVVGLPMLLDSEPKPLAGDIAIHIPSKEKAPALPAPSAPVPAEDSVDSGEEIVETPAVAEPAPAAAARAEPVRIEPAPQEPARPEPAKAPPSPEPKAPAKPEPKGEPKVAEKSAPKPARLDDKPADGARSADEAARALAILEGKPVDKPADKPAGASQKFVVQVAALASQEKVAELQARLRAAGVSSYTQKSGELIRVRVGPFGSKEEAEKVRAKLSGLGLSGTMVPV
jgi:DedD protein